MKHCPWEELALQGFRLVSWEGSDLNGGGSEAGVTLKPSVPSPRAFLGLGQVSQGSDAPRVRCRDSDPCPQVVAQDPRTPGTRFIRVLGPGLSVRLRKRVPRACNAVRDDNVRHLEKTPIFHQCGVSSSFMLQRTRSSNTHIRTKEPVSPWKQGL